MFDFEIYITGRNVQLVSPQKEQCKYYDIHTPF